MASSLALERAGSLLVAAGHSPEAFVPALTAQAAKTPEVAVLAETLLAPAAS
jgi:hypothetical protein